MGKKVTTDDWVEQARQRWGDRFDYSKAEYRGKNERIEIGCPVHGWTLVNPQTHLLKRPGSTGCPRCGKEQAGAKRRSPDWEERQKRVKMKERITEEIFRDRLLKRWGESLTLVSGTYRSTDKSVEVVCAKHHLKIIYSRAGNLLARTKLYPCEQCKIEEKTQLFIANARAIHGDKYNYDKTIWNKSGLGITVTCLLHGDWNTGLHHAKKSAQSGCPTCGLAEVNRERREIAAREFAKKANKVHKNKYDYEKCEYINNYTPVEIKCKHHEIYFYQSPNSHLNGHGCPECALDRARADRIPSIKGLTFGRLTVVELDHVRERKGRANGQVKYWRCQCSCGKQVVTFQTSLTCGQTRSCGCLKHDNLINAEISALENPEVAAVETELYFVKVGKAFQKFGISVHSAEVRGGSDYEQIYWRTRERRDIALPVEYILHKMTINYFSLKSIEEHGFEEWPGWTELRSGLDKEFWIAKAQQLIVECHEMGYKTFVDHYEGDEYE